ncbi:MAG: hypothetical protein RMJ51_04980 [Candidatus Calescibacterium sp.]|nr:hypothetical protein [Candidatus Calescibacterium sp.]MCX7972534.1 hypothetical protein [bacterium]MDW8195573.1 hypothetical protein [Candidatus Calescibacterium sp.]
MKILGFILFLIITIFFFSSCGGNKNFVTIFKVDKDTGIFIPISYISKGYEQDLLLIVKSLMDVNAQKIEKTGTKIDIYLDRLPNISYQYDSYILYTSLFLSIFNSFPFQKVNFFYDQKLVILKGIEYSMSSYDYYKYPINDIFNLGDVRKGKYFIYGYSGKEFLDRFVLILLPYNYDMALYFNSSIKEISKKINAKIETLDRIISRKHNIHLVKYNKNHFVFRSYDLLRFFLLYFDRSKMYYLFYNSDIDFVVVLQRFLWFDLSIKIVRPRNLYLNKYPLNER